MRTMDESDSDRVPDRLFDPRLGRTKMLLEQDRHAEGLFVLQAAMRDAMATLTSGFLLEGLLRGHLEDWEGALEAIDRFRSIVEGEPHEAIAEANRAWILGHLGRGQEGLEATDRALVLSRDERLRPRILLNRALALRCLNRTEEALSVIDEAAALAPEDPEVAFDRAG